MEEQPSIYDEHYLDLTHEKQTRVSSRPIPTKKEVFFDSDQKSKKRWNTPIVPREKLSETLNALEMEGYEIFTILTVSASTLQVIYFQEEEIDE